MASICHARNSQIKPQRLGMALSISVTTLLVLFVPLLILGLSPSASAGPPQGPVLPGALLANAHGLALWLASTTIAHAQQTNGLQLDKRPGANPISPGDRLSLILTLTNNGEDELTDLS